MTEKEFEANAEDYRAKAFLKSPFMHIESCNKAQISFTDIAEDAALRYILSRSQSFMEIHPLKMGISVSIITSVVLATICSILLAVGATVIGIMLFAPLVTDVYLTAWIIKLLEEREQRKWAS